MKSCQIALKLGMGEIDKSTINVPKMDNQRSERENLRRENFLYWYLIVILNNRIAKSCHLQKFSLHFNMNLWVMTATHRPADARVVST